ncbi:MAG TPA: fibro-slime domain-containing protein [Polyangiaceae bacterium]|nr:fibro-slime domain-containing protein [Polyangiaceae bacterium]
MVKGSLVAVPFLLSGLFALAGCGASDPESRQSEQDPSFEPGGGKSPPTGNVSNGVSRCDRKLTGVIRDFDPRMHPDFEPADKTLTTPAARNGMAKAFKAETGIVERTLGPDFKPQYAKDPSAGSATTYGAAWFQSWFRDTPNLNSSMEYAIEFSDPDGDRVFTFDSGASQFFPIDHMLLGNWPDYPPNDPQGGLHNYSFTYELHAKFLYRKTGMIFRFSGDDDVWVFINGKLVVDLGGIHATEVGEVNLDKLGLNENDEYQLDFFWAERHVAQSNFRIDTSMEFSDCNVAAPR